MKNRAERKPGERKIHPWSNLICCETMEREKDRQTELGGRSTVSNKTSRATQSDLDSGGRDRGGVGGGERSERRFVPISSHRTLLSQIPTSVKRALFLPSNPESNFTRWNYLPENLLRLIFKIGRANFGRRRTFTFPFERGKRAAQQQQDMDAGRRKKKVPSEIVLRNDTHLLVR